MECSRPSRYAPPNRNRCGSHKYLRMVCGGSIQIIRHESAGYGGRFCSNRGSVRHNRANFSVRIGQTSFAESNRIGQTGLFPNGAERSGLGNGILVQNAQLAESAERQNGQNAERRRKAILADFSPKIRFAPIWGNRWLTGSYGFHSCMNEMLTI